MDRNDLISLESLLDAATGVDTPRKERSVRRELDPPRRGDKRRRVSLGADSRRCDVAQPRRGDVERVREARPALVRHAVNLGDDHGEENDADEAGEKATERVRRARRGDEFERHNSLRAPEFVRVDGHRHAVQAKVGGHRLAVGLERHFQMFSWSAYRRSVVV